MQLLSAAESGNVPHKFSHLQKGDGFQSIGEVVYVDEKQDWVQDTALAHFSLHWENRGEGSFDITVLTA